MDAQAIERFMDYCLPIAEFPFTLPFADTRANQSPSPLLPEQRSGEGCPEGGERARRYGFWSRTSSNSASTTLSLLPASPPVPPGAAPPPPLDSPACCSAPFLYRASARTWDALVSLSTPAVILSRSSPCIRVFSSSIAACTSLRLS